MSGLASLGFGDRFRNWSDVDRQPNIDMHSAWEMQAFALS